MPHGFPEGAFMEQMESETNLVNRQTGEIVDSQKRMNDAIVIESVKNYMATKPAKIFGEGDKARRHPEIDDWQFAGSFFGLVAKSEDAQYVELGDKKGFKAKARIFNREGQEVGSGEAYCMNDEGFWRSAALSKLASMAQTRAVCKAYANILRPVMHSAGFSTTPSEEMDDVQRAPIMQPRPKRESGSSDRGIPSNTPPSDDSWDSAQTESAELPSSDGIDFPEPSERKTISEKQRKFLFAKYKSANITDEKMKTTIKVLFGLDHSADLTTKQLNQLVDLIDKGGIK